MYLRNEQAVTFHIRLFKKVNLAETEGMRLVHVLKGL